ncbi:DMT family transporter [Tumebacillus sp. DT12]|uniref:DMT family transporter n=1 Tax=Tumebacillus lacus TaxID=2995335 RepID=A0ABT3WZB6_9BACL|nr:DMT family transporter [Tumebacillus lacus]MCX7570002.1 DMT family transporter [Tumebacillus lacus]
MNRDGLVKGMIFCFLAVVAWGGMFPVAGNILKVMDPFWFTSIRYGTAVIVFLILLALMEGKKSFGFDNRGWWLYFFGTMGFAGFSFLTFAGQKMLGVSGAVVASIIMALMPVNTLIVNTLLGRAKPSGFGIGMMLVALFGVLLVITKGNPATLLATTENLIGDILIYLGALSWVIYTIGGTTFPTWSPIRYTALSTLLGMISVLLITIAGTAFGLLSVPTLEGTFSVGWELLYMAMIAGVMAVFLWNFGNRILTPINGILFMNLVPITTFTITIIQGGTFTSVELLGAGITIIALVANNLYNRRVAARAAAAAKAA